MANISEKAVYINENMEYGRKWAPTNRKTKTEVVWCYTKRHEGYRSAMRRSTRPENMAY